MSTVTLNGVTYDLASRTKDDGSGPIPFTSEEEEIVPLWSEIQSAQESAQAQAEEQAEIQARINASFDSMFELTEAIKEWCANALGYVMTGGQGMDPEGVPYSTPSAQEYTQFGIDGEGVLLSYNALDPGLLVSNPRLIKQRSALDGRIAQAMWIKDLLP